MKTRIILLSPIYFPLAIKSETKSVAGEGAGGEEGGSSSMRQALRWNPGL